MKIPSTQHQIPNKHQCSKQFLDLGIGILDLFEIWILGFGI
jgi:hypothetical protein